MMRLHFFSCLLNEEITLQKQAIFILEQGVTFGSSCIYVKICIEFTLLEILILVFEAFGNFLQAF